jgi:hypothetical protein
MKYGLAKGAATLVPPGNSEHFQFMLDHIDECLDHPLNDNDLDFSGNRPRKSRTTRFSRNEYIIETDPVQIGLCAKLFRR